MPFSQWLLQNFQEAQDAEHNAHQNVQVNQCAENSQSQSQNEAQNRNAGQKARDTDHNTGNDTEYQIQDQGNNELANLALFARKCMGKQLLQNIHDEKSFQINDVIVVTHC